MLRVPSLTSVHGSFAAVPILQVRRQRLGRDVAWQRQTAHGEWGSVVPTPPQGGPPDSSCQRRCFLSFFYLVFAALGLPCCGGCPRAAASRGCSLAAECGLLTAVLSGCRARAVVRALSSCGTCAQVLCGMWDLSSLTRDPIHTPTPDTSRRFLNHCTTREAPVTGF